MNKQALQSMDGFTGTMQYHRASLFILCTDGVLHLCENASAYWLLDAIGSYQPTKKIRSTPGLLEFQAWKLRPGKELNSATLICEDGNNNEVLRQEIEYSDFPFDVIPEAVIWVEPTGEGKPLALLPSEH